MMIAGVGILDIDGAEAQAIKYALDHPATVRYFDYAGQGELPGPSDGLSLNDIGRLVVINAELRADDVPALLAASNEVDWASVPHGLKLTDLDTDPRNNDPSYRAVEAIYSSFRSRKGIGHTKASKALHLKRPDLFPILDRQVRDLYETAATEMGASFGSAVPHYWAAMAKDLRDNESSFNLLQQRLAAHDREEVRRVARLGHVRLLDLLSWALFPGRSD